MHFLPCGLHLKINLCCQIFRLWIDHWLCNTGSPIMTIFWDSETCHCWRACVTPSGQQSEPNCQNGRGTLTLKKESVFSRQALYSIQGFSLNSRLMTINRGQWVLPEDPLSLVPRLPPLLLPLPVPVSVIQRTRLVIDRTTVARGVGKKVVSCCWSRIRRIAIEKTQFGLCSADQIASAESRCNNHFDNVEVGRIFTAPSDSEKPGAISHWFISANWTMQRDDQGGYESRAFDWILSWVDGLWLMADIIE